MMGRSRSRRENWRSIMVDRILARTRFSLHMPRTVCAAVLALTFTPSLAKAELNPCELSSDQWETALSDILVGVWNVQNGPGAARLAGMAIPLPPEAVGTITIASIDGDLTAVGQGPEMVADFAVDFVPDESWAFDTLVFSDDPPPYVDLDTLALTYDLNCASDLPRIRFSGRIPIENTALAITMDMVVFSENTLIGVGDFVLPMDAGAMEANRLMTFSR
jgi:hypothetical protein